MTEELTTTTTLYCAYHPGRETLLRCNRCEKPICTDCAIRTPVGFRCRDCVRGQQAVYFNANPADLPVAGVVSFILAAILGGLAFIILSRVSFIGIFLAIFAGPAAGGLIAEGVRRSVGRRRARSMNAVAVGAALVAMVLAVLFLTGAFAGVPLARILPALLFRWSFLIFAVLAGSTIYARLQ